MSRIKDYLTIEGAAARRGCSTATIWRRIRAGELEPRRIFGRLVLLVTEVDALEMPDGGGRWRKAASESSH